MDLYIHQILYLIYSRPNNEDKKKLTSQKIARIAPMQTYVRATMTSIYRARDFRTRYVSDGVRVN